MNGKQVKKLRSAVVHFVARLSDEINYEHKEIIAGKMYKNLKRTFESLDSKTKGTFQATDDVLMKVFKEISDAMGIQNRNRERYEQKIREMIKHYKKTMPEKVALEKIDEMNPINLATKNPFNEVVNEAS